MKLAGQTNLTHLAHDLGLRAEPIAGLLDGRSLPWQKTLDTWTDALQERADRLGTPAEIAAVRAIGDTAKPAEDRLLWFRWNQVYRWPQLPPTRAGEWAMFYDAVLTAQIVADFSIHTGSDPECMCDVLAAQPEGPDYRRQGNGTFKLSGRPRQWRSQQAFLDAWQMPPTAWSRRTVIRKASRNPADVAEYYMRARINSRRSDARCRCY